MGRDCSRRRRARAATRRETGTRAQHTFLRARRLAEARASRHRHGTVTRSERIRRLLRHSLPWLALLLFVLWGTRGLSPSAAFAVGQRLPAFSATLSDGSAFSPANGQITVLNFWASYCGPCRSEAPLLSAAQAAEVKVVGLSVEALQTKIVAQQAANIGMRYPVGVADEALLSRFRVQSVPTTYVISKRGKLVLSRVGAISESELHDALADARAER
jgi:cytochrome c biogenesis protein CcmG/thiol:disulfide interchange protein DsbE